MRVLMAIFLFSLASPADTRFSFPAAHDHVLGRCRGTLVFAEQAVRYESPSHSAQWPYNEIQELRLLETTSGLGRVRLLTYQDSGKWRLGADRAFTYHVEGHLKEALELLAGKLDQRLVIGFANEPKKTLAEFPVKHLRPLGGTEATLAFSEDTVVLRCTANGESRTWRYADIESLNSSDPFRLTITTFERQKLHYATRRVFNFQLKQSLPEETYNMLWRRLNRPRDLEVVERLRNNIESQADAAAKEAGSPEQNAPQVEGPVNEPPGRPEAEFTPMSLPASSYRPMITGILREEGLPAELIGVAKVESNFNRFALSPKNARGLWQFIPETARRFGLRVDALADERVDPEKSTRAAARYLKELYGMFGDWKLALAGYNAGEKRVQTAVARAGTTNFARLATLLPRETRNYVPAVLATFEERWGSAPVSGRHRLFAPLSLSYRESYRD